MVADDLYEKALPVLQDEALDEEDKTDKLEELLAAPEKRAIMGAYGRRRVEQELAWEYERPKLINAYVRRGARTWVGKRA